MCDDCTSEHRYNTACMPLLGLGLVGMFTLFDTQAVDTIMRLCEVEIHFSAISLFTIFCFLLFQYFAISKTQWSLFYWLIWALEFLLVGSLLIVSIILLQLPDTSPQNAFEQQDCFHPNIGLMIEFTWLIKFQIFFWGSVCIPLYLILFLVLQAKLKSNQINTS